MISRKEQKKMFRRYRAGATLAELGAEHGLSRERIRQIFAAAGVERRKFTTPERRAVRAAKYPAGCRFGLKEADLRRLYTEERKTLAEIGVLYGCSARTVAIACEYYKIPRRTRRETKGFCIPKFAACGRNLLRRLYIEENRTAGEIARMFECSRITVYQQLRAFGLRKRFPRERVSLDEPLPPSIPGHPDLDTSDEKINPNNPISEIIKRRKQC